MKQKRRVASHRSLTLDGSERPDAAPSKVSAFLQQSDVSEATESSQGRMKAWIRLPSITLHTHRAEKSSLDQVSKD